MKKIIVTSLFLILLLASCNNVIEEAEEEINLLDPIEVELNMKSQLVVDDEMVTEAIITQKGEPVTDANEVVFEIWQHGNPDSYQLLEGFNEGKGAYEVSWTARDVGVYYIYYHVTARGMHRMEKHQFVVGDVDVDKVLETPDERPQKHMH